jgi:photoactive yellow protein
MEIVKFDESDIENRLAGMKAGEMNELAFGAIQLDRNGKILFYNAAEGEITGRNPEEVIGKDFFREVAPCTQSPEFYGRFQDGVEKGALSTLFEYVFDYQMKPTKVKVHMKKALSDDTYWVLVKRVGV